VLFRSIEIIAITKQQNQHQNYLEILQNKAKINKPIIVAFFALFSSVWKYEGIYRLMEKDDRFDPIVVVVPVVSYGEDFMREEMDKTYKVFLSKGYNVVRTYNIEYDNYLDIKESINPDIIFYSSPYKDLIDYRYYITEYKSILSCYVQYAFGISDIKVVDQFDMLFHNLVWKIFQESKYHLDYSQKHSRNKGVNAIYTGYPGTDFIQYKQRLNNYIWKNNDTSLKRIIWAPHHTIEKEENLSISNFILYHELMIEIAEENRHSIQIAFKPHPLLKVKLYSHKEWGKAKTDAYYYKFSNLPNGQLETDDYLDLFNSSDALIHDSGSFMAEYLFSGKPALFTLVNDDIRNRFSDFGNTILDHHYKAYTANDVIKFIKEIVIDGNDYMGNSRNEFYYSNLVPPNDVSASQNIYNYISKAIWRR
jgi:hypothetical protein